MEGLQMAKFYSPDGNIEVWDTKPDGYFTVEEWEEMHPYIPPVPTKEEQIAALTVEYTQEKSNLCEAYTTASMHGDTETSQSVAQDMADLDSWFDEEYRKIEGSAE
jgi:hypothetical protein